MREVPPPHQCEGSKRDSWQPFSHVQVLQYYSVRKGVPVDNHIIMRYMVRHAGQQCPTSVWNVVLYHGAEFY